MKWFALFAFLLGAGSVHAGENPSINPALIDVQTGVSNPAPAQVTLQSYQQWATPLLRQGDTDNVSAFTSRLFEWYEAEKNRPLPPEVYRDAEKIYVNVQRPLAETIELEEAGEITEGNTVGAEVYAEQAGTMREALATMLFRWGKPTGAADGRTYPPGGQFQKRVDYFAANSDWGPGAYASLTMRRNGGLVKDLFDRYFMLIRGNEQDGYDVFMQYYKPGGATPTEKCFAIAMLRPIAAGKVAYKISTRYQGQSYKILGGIKIGRAQVGFNVQKVRAIQVESNGFLRELQQTGTIKDRKTDIEWGQP